MAAYHEAPRITDAPLTLRHMPKRPKTPIRADFPGEFSVHLKKLANFWRNLDDFEEVLKLFVN